MKRFHFTLDNELYDDIQRLANEKKCAMADVVRMALATFILSEDVKKEILLNKLEEKHLKENKEEK